MPETIKFPISKVTKETIMHVELVGMKSFTFRLRIAKGLIWLAAKIAGFGIEFHPQIIRDVCKGCGADFAEFPEMRHSQEDCPGAECTCCEVFSGHQMGCPFYGSTN